jgi:hypothetical protein
VKPDSGFDDPIGMLINRHRRIERSLHVLWGAANRAGTELWQTKR